MDRDCGALVVSLDFELFWGLRHAATLSQSRQRLLGARAAIPRMLELFRRYEVHATWATVGTLFFESKESLRRGLPEREPKYSNSRYPSVSDLSEVGADETEDPFHYGLSLLDQVRACPFQEIGTHTFSHYYCLEEGQDESMFRADLQACVQAARRHGISLESIVFPRNQVNDRYLPICREVGITSYRGTENAWIYRAQRTSEESPQQRLIRLGDAYVNLSGHNVYPFPAVGADIPVNIPASRFLRPYLPKLGFLEGVRTGRITSSLRAAARERAIFHLWWHPHNFGIHTEPCLAVLERVLKEFASLRERTGMRSMNMSEVARLAIGSTPKVEPVGATR